MPDIAIQSKAKAAYGHGMCQVRAACWRLDKLAIAGVRREVFIEEQQVPEALEWESIDADCDWFVAESGLSVIGIVRLTPEGRIGRMAVMAAWRKHGVGRALLNAVLERARGMGFTEVVLSAQSQAIGFYARFDFVAEGPEFIDAGIPHRRMRLIFKEI